jgi:hypothetical protein
MTILFSIIFVVVHSQSVIGTPVSKSVSSMSCQLSSKKQRNKENIDCLTSDDASPNTLDTRRKANEHDKYIVSKSNEPDQYSCVYLDGKLNATNLSRSIVDKTNAYAC